MATSSDNPPAGTMVSSTSSLGLLYDDDGYIETPGHPLSLDTPSRTGLLGRQVAGKEFLDALFDYGTWENLIALVRNQASAETVTGYFERHEIRRKRGRSLRVVNDRGFLDAFFPDPPASLVYTPNPPDIRYAWARHHRGTDGFALCGVTHTLCSQRAMEWLGQLLIGPFEPYDTMICTSTAVLRMVRSVTNTYADFLRERMGGDPQVRPRLEVIPLGVDTEKYHPPSPEERLVRREALGIGHDEVVVLFVGRLSHHTKAHPFPLFHALDRAATETGRKVRLILSGWAHNQAVFQAFVEGAAAFASNVRVTVVDGTRPENRFAVWHAADIFSSLSDNIQETFGLVIAEAMATGLPVVASDWDGYRDLVTDGETGLLVPTLMIPGATTDSTAKLILEAHSYDHFLAETSQAVAVDCSSAVKAFSHLIVDESERRRLGTVARRTALQRFAWAEVINAYERLWGEQEKVRQEHTRVRKGRPSSRGPTLYPNPEIAFEGYPSRWLAESDTLIAVPGATDRLDALLKSPLVTHAAWARLSDPAALRALLAKADGCTIEQLVAILTKQFLSQTTARATLAWMLKYDLLRLSTPSGLRTMEST